MAAIDSLLNGSTFQHHRDIDLEGYRVASFCPAQRGFDSADARLVLCIAQQRQLRASVTLQLRVSQYGAAPSSLPEPGRDSTFHVAEAGTQHCIGYLS